MGAVRDFLEKHYRHFNAREVVAAARAYEAHIATGGKGQSGLNVNVGPIDRGFIDAGVGIASAADRPAGWGVRSFELRLLPDVTFRNCHTSVGFLPS